MMYGGGQGVRTDAIAAHMWMNLSYQNGNERASQGMVIIEEQITARQVREAERLAIKCKASNYQDCG